jgi:hypothetical protein
MMQQGFSTRSRAAGGDLHADLPGLRSVGYRQLGRISAV